MYAQVIINQSNINVDQYYDYIIPEELINIIKVGQRVIVPFGRGNKKIDAFIIRIEDFTDIKEKRLKYVEQIIDPDPILTNNQLKLADWIRNNYLCLHIEAIQLMIPTGVNLEKKTSLILNKNIVTNEFLLNLKNEEEKRILNYLTIIDKEIRLDELKKEFKDVLYRRITDMAKKSYIFIREYFYPKVNDKKEKYISLSGKYNNKGEYLKELSSNAHKQIDIIKSLDNHPLNYNELYKELKFNTSSINALIKKGLIKIDTRMFFRDPYKDKDFKYPKVKLTIDQERIIKEFKKLSHDNPQKLLIHGVTGSGKTEIYLNMIEEMLKKGKQSILLVPEISLTPQMVERVMGRFGDQVSILHSGLSIGEKYDQWKRIKSGKASIVIGARSAIFAPLNNLGLIIIDEEHETTYKSSIRPRYHAREIGEKRCDYENCHLVIGTATPAIESYYRSMNKEYKLFLLEKRIDDIPMPSVSFVDMRNELKGGNYSILSNTLREEIKDSLNKKQQIILFLNRRGYSTFISCRECGYVEKCPNCDVSLIYHHTKGVLMCHYCGYTKNLSKICPDCKGNKIKYFGTGTQKVEKIIGKEFPEARILRMDIDTTKRKGAHDRILNLFKSGKADILIGTQMIAKGLDFPNVTLVGIITADTSLNLPDFRAAERTFQLTTQVAGRAGRGILKGKVIVQTYEPKHYSLIHAKNHDYLGFYQEEIAIRKEMSYPPFTKIINIVFSYEDEGKLIKFSHEFYRIVINYLKSSNMEYLFQDVYQPVPAQISKISNKFRWHLIIKTKQINKFRSILREIYREYLIKGSQINISIDIDPVSLL